MGRPFGTKNIESPEKMWELFEQYCQWVKDNPYIVKDWVGAQAVKVEREKERPLTLEGFEIYLFKQGILSDFQQYFENRDNRYAEFVYICSRIKKAIRDEQINGGMAGMYNPSITQRLNNLVEKTEAQVTAAITQVTPQVITSDKKIAESESDVDETR